MLVCCGDLQTVDLNVGMLCGDLQTVDLNVGMLW